MRCSESPSQIQLAMFSAYHDFDLVGEGGSIKVCTQINLSEKYYFVGKSCDRFRQKKGVGGYMKEVDRAEKKKWFRVLQRL